MRLISCHITGFGKFENRAFDLSAQTVHIHGENGWGKTTLVDFIASMLYGIDGGRSKTVAANDRIRYAPFSGARFGGALIFSYQGKTYRVERFFGKTPSGDSVKIYDENNMQSYVFGDKCERLGETLFGMDRTSFEKCTYIPQGGVETGELTGDIKTRLIALLASGAENGAQSAIERLDNAERALRAKRKPAKGKLDELDEKLAYLHAKQAECLKMQDEAKAKRLEVQENERRLQALKVQVDELSIKIEDYSRKSERTATRAAYNEIKASAEEAQRALARLTAFFGQTAPQTVNASGLKTAVEEYYAVKAEIAQLQEGIAEFSETATKRESLKMRISVNEEAIENYKVLLSQKGEKTDKKVDKKGKKQKKGGSVKLVLALLVAIVGAVFIESQPALGIILLSVGALGILLSAFSLLRSAGSGYKKIAADKSIQGAYLKLLAETKALKAELLEIAENDGEERTLREKLEQRQTRLAALDKAIQDFLAHFAFGEIYDYRACLLTLEENIAAHARYSAALTACEERLQAYDLPQTDSDEEITGAEIEEIKARLTQTQRERELLTGETARLAAQTESLEKQAAALGDLQAEEERLAAEKARLEKRLTAIRGAREILTRAQANMATRYLEPVEKRVRQYAQILGFPFSAVRFSAEGTPLIEENGSMRQSEYYSTGLQELLWLCIRLALAETLFVKELPPLMFDDPFVNLDDDKTARAKALLKTLSSRFQIVYCTCKKERSL